MKFVFFGTSEFSITVLKKLMESGFIPSLIVSQPDKAAGRKLKITAPPIKPWAQKNNIQISQPEKLSKIDNYDLGVTAAYGKLIPPEVIQSLKYGILNVHPSLLPRYRGPTPIQSAILAGEKVTGVTIMLVDEEMDHGDIVANIKHQTPNLKNYKELEKKLAEVGGKLLTEVIPKWLAEEIKARPQDHSQATFTKKFTTEDAFIEPEIVLGGSTANLAVEPPSATPSANLAAFRKVLALNPEPGTWTRLGAKRVKITEAKLENGKFIPNKVIPAGKREMGWGEFRRGNRF